MRARWDGNVRTGTQRYTDNVYIPKQGTALVPETGDEKMKCDFCGRENIPLKFVSINTGIKIYECVCGHKKTVKDDEVNQ